MAPHIIVWGSAATPAQNYGHASNTGLSSRAPARDATPRSGSMAHAWDTFRADADVTILKRTGECQAVFRRLKGGVQISQEGSYQG